MDIYGPHGLSLVHLVRRRQDRGRSRIPKLDVGENLRLAQRPAADGSGWTLERIFDYFPVRERWRQRGRSLSGGEQQVLAIAHALAGNPVLVLGKGAVVFAGPAAEFRHREAELKGRYLSV